MINDQGSRWYRRGFVFRGVCLTGRRLPITLLMMVSIQIGCFSAATDGCATPSKTIALMDSAPLAWHVDHNRHGYREARATITRPIRGILENQQTHPDYEMSTAPLADQTDINDPPRSLFKQYQSLIVGFVAMFDLEMKYPHYSQRWITDLHLPDEDLTGRCHYEVVVPFPERWKKEHQRCLQGEYIRKEEESVIRPDGSVEWVRRTLYPWRTHDENIGGIIILVELTTERKRAELAAKKAETNLRLMERVVENSPVALFRWAVATGWPVVYMSKKEEPFLDHTGTMRWLEVTKLPCDPRDFGEPAVVGLATDITERRQSGMTMSDSLCPT